MCPHERDRGQRSVAAAARVDDDGPEPEAKEAQRLVADGPLRSKPLPVESVSLARSLARSVPPSSFLQNPHTTMQAIVTSSATAPQRPADR